MSCCLELGGPPKVTFEVVLPKGMLSKGYGEGCCLLGLGDCLGTGVGGVAGAGCSSTGEALCDRMNGGDGDVFPIKCGRKLPECSWTPVGWFTEWPGRWRGSQFDFCLLSDDLHLQILHDAAMFHLE